MSHTRIQELTAVRREFYAARYALAYVTSNWDRIIGNIGNADAERPTLRDHRGALEGLERTYLIRLFSQFEAVLRDFLREQGRRVPRNAENLINRAALMQHVDDTIRDAAHAVRDYRNLLVHEANVPAVTVPFVDALRFLSRFVAYLPEPPGTGRRVI